MLEAELKRVVETLGPSACRRTSGASMLSHVAQDFVVVAHSVPRSAPRQSRTISRRALLAGLGH